MLLAFTLSTDRSIKINPLMPLLNPQTPPLPRALPRQLNQSYDVSCTLRLDRYIAFPCQRLCKLRIKGAVCGWLDVGTQFSAGLSVDDRCESTGTFLGLDAEAGISRPETGFQLFFLAVQMELWKR